MSWESVSGAGGRRSEFRSVVLVLVKEAFGLLLSFTNVVCVFGIIAMHVYDKKHYTLSARQTCQVLKRVAAAREARHIERWEAKGEEEEERQQQEEQQQQQQQKRRGKREIKLKKGEKLVRKRE